MRWKWIFLAPLAILAIAAFVFIGGQLVLHLWNWLLPPLFGFPQVTFWQARTPGAVPDPLRRIRLARFRPLPCPRPCGRAHGRAHGRSLGRHDA